MMRLGRRLLLVGMLVSVSGIALLAGRGDVAAQTVGVTIQNFLYTPATATISPGGAVLWTQRDTVAHTVTSGTPNGTNSGSLFDNTLLKVGDTYTFAFSAPGAYPYYCRFHPWMLGTVQVGDAAAPQATATPVPAPTSTVPPPTVGAPVPGPAGSTVIASGLRSPRGFTWGADGAIYVAEAGTQPVVAGAPDPSPRTPLYNVDGRVSRIAADGTRSTVADGLPVVIQFDGEASGPAAVAWTADVLWLLITKNGDDGHPDWVTGVYGVNADGSTTLLTDLEAYNKANPQAFIPPDNAISNPYDMISLGNKLYIVDGNANVVFEVDPALPPATNTRHLADLSEQLGGHPVTTGIAAGPDGNLYVTNLTKAPFPQGGARVWQITLAGDVTEAATGLSLGVGIALDPSGTIYVSEYAASSNFTPPGRIVTANSTGITGTVADGILFPTILRWGPDGALYVTYYGAKEAAGTAGGGIYRIPVGGR